MRTFLGISVLCLGLGLGLGCSGTASQQPTPEKTPVVSSPEPSVTDELLKTARGLFAAGDFSGAAAQARTALDILEKEETRTEKMVEARRLLATSAYKAREYETAYKQFKILVDLHPAKAAEYRANIAQLRAEMGKAELKSGDRSLAEAREALQKKRYPEAREKALKALAIYKAHGAEPGQASRVLAQAEAGLRQGEQRRTDARLTQEYGALPPRRLTKQEAARLPDNQKVFIRQQTTVGGGGEGYWTTRKEWERYQKEGGRASTSWY